MKINASSWIMLLISLTKKNMHGFVPLFEYFSISPSFNNFYTEIQRSLKSSVYTNQWMLLTLPGEIRLPPVSPTSLRCKSTIFFKLSTWWKPWVITSEMSSSDPVTTQPESDKTSIKINIKGFCKQVKITHVTWLIYLGIIHIYYWNISNTFSKCQISNI